MNEGKIEIVTVKLIINGDEFICAPQTGFFVDPNQEPWPEKWTITYDTLGYPHLTINA